MCEVIEDQPTVALSKDHFDSMCTLSKEELHRKHFGNIRDEEITPNLNTMNKACLTFSYILADCNEIGE